MAFQWGLVDPTSSRGPIFTLFVTITSKPILQLLFDQGSPSWPCVLRLIARNDLDHRPRDPKVLLPSCECRRLVAQKMRMRRCFSFWFSMIAPPHNWNQIVPKSYWTWSEKRTFKPSSYEKCTSLKVVWLFVFPARIWTNRCPKISGLTKRKGWSSLFQKGPDICKSGSFTTGSLSPLK